MRVAGVGLKKMLLDAEQKKVIIFYAVATCALVAWLCNMKAMSTWCKQPPSCLSRTIGTGVSEPLPTCVHAQTI